MHHWALMYFIYLAFPGFGRATPHKALVYDPQILLPVVHFETVHMGTPGWTHDRTHIRVPLYFSDEICSTEVTRRIIHQLFRFARQCGVEDAYLIHAWSVS